jgi:hypothetical protein
MYELNKITTDNLTYLEDIKNYIETHKKDFKQVFFKPTPNHVKSSRVGVFIKDIYGNEQVTPVYQAPGYHTKDSCELNTAIYANSTIDYNSPTNYVPGVKQVVVKGDFANSPNYFLTGSPASTEDANVSVEITGYIVADVPGNYQVVYPFTQNALVWVGNNAVKTYRKENTNFIVDNGVKTKNYSFKMVAGEYTPFRIQYSGNAQIDYTQIWLSTRNNKITKFATNASENNLYYYSLTASDKANLYKCDIYKGSELQKYKSDAKQQVNLVWSTPLAENTDFVFLDMVGNLSAYDSNYEKINSIQFPQYPKINQLKAASYRLKLYQRNLQPLCIKDAQNVVTPIITIANLNTVKNNEWAKSQNPMINVMSNRTEQVGDKRISIDRISESNPLFSNNFRYKLCIMRDKVGNKILALLASTVDRRSFYTAEPDLKMNKLFYASTYPENKFLREVPADLQTNGNTYIKFSDKHPLTPGNFTTIADSNCEKQCNSTLGCNYFYKVMDAAGATSCLIPQNNEPVYYLPKQPDSQYISSELNIKNKIIQTGNKDTDAVYNEAKYIANGYADTVNLRFADYHIERKVLSKSDTPGPEGTSYVRELQNSVLQRTNGTKPISLTNINNPMNAGKIENFTTVVDRSLTKLNEIGGQFDEYNKNVYKINPNRIDINNKITAINQTYLDMSGNQEKYDFTGQTIYALEKEDRSLTASLLKDNAIYKEEQNTVYVVTTLTMATLLVAAVLVAK